MLENYDDKTSRCILCSAKLEASDKAEFYNFNGMGAMCSHCMSGPHKPLDHLTISIERFLIGNVV